jgi:hypothetical protein
VSKQRFGQPVVGLKEPQGVREDFPAEQLVPDKRVSYRQTLRRYGDPGDSRCVKEQFLGPTTKRDGLGPVDGQDQVCSLGAVAEAQIKASNRVVRVASADPSDHGLSQPLAEAGENPTCGLPRVSATDGVGTRDCQVTGGFGDRKTGMSAKPVV